MKPVLIGLVRFYQIVLSRPLHWLGGPAAGCRFTPTCSQFFLEAVKIHGAGRGSWLGLKRLLRCHPWGGHGCDPVPPAKPSVGVQNTSEAARGDSASSLSSVSRAGGGSEPGSGEPRVAWKPLPPSPSHH